MLPRKFSFPSPSCIYDRLAANISAHDVPLLVGYTSWNVFVFEIHGIAQFHDLAVMTRMTREGTVGDNGWLSFFIKN
jgi:hypothetical protein